MARLAGRVAGVPRALGSFLDRRGGLVLVRVGGEDGDGVPGGHDGGCPGPGRVAGDALPQRSGAPAESASSLAAFLEVKECG